MKNMKTIVKTLMAIGLVGTLASCKSTFNATETLQDEESRNAIYQEIISKPVQFTNFISEAQKNEGQYGTDGSWKYENDDGEKSRNERKNAITYAEDDGKKSGNDAEDAIQNAR